jgi:hypothetical protein
MPVTINGTNGVTFNDSSVQGASAIGYGQTWTDVKASRATDVTYTNSTGKPIMVCFTPVASGSMFGYARINGANILYQQFTPSGGGGCAGWTFIVPAGSTYLIANLSNMGTIAEWQELR